MARQRAKRAARARRNGREKPVRFRCPVRIPGPCPRSFPKAKVASSILAGGAKAESRSLDGAADVRGADQSAASGLEAAPNHPARLVRVRCRSFHRGGDLDGLAQHWATPLGLIRVTST